MRYTLSRIPFHEECFKSESKRGDPKYLVGKVEIENPKILEILHWFIIEVLKKKTLDFSRFIVVLEASEKIHKTRLRVGDS